MLRFEKLEVFNIHGALRGMRNPLNSWHRSDSRLNEIGPNDLDLAKRLIKGGPEHRKFMRQIFVSVDITAPLYWWKEFDTYKLGTTSNSCSTMHKIMSQPFTLDQFSMETVQMHDLGIGILTPGDIVDYLNKLRDLYNEETDAEKKKIIFRIMIQMLPSSYNQKRTITMNYENLYNIYTQRVNHKLSEWSNDFMELIQAVPYAKELILYRGGTNEER